MIGSASDDIFRTLRVDDSVTWMPLSINGGNGNDCLEGGAIGDLIDGGAGEDIIFSQGGSDTILGGPNDDGNKNTSFSYLFFNFLTLI